MFVAGSLFANGDSSHYFFCDAYDRLQLRYPIISDHTMGSTAPNFMFIAGPNDNGFAVWSTALAASNAVTKSCQQTF